MAIFESIQLAEAFPFRFLINYGHRLTTPHFHGEYEIIYMEKGNVNLGVGKELFQLEEKQIFIVHPHLEHYIVPEKDSIRYVYQFDPALFGNILLQSDAVQFESIQPNSAFWHKEVSDAVIQMLEAMKHEIEQKKKGYELAIIAALLQMQVILMRYECRKTTAYSETKKVQKLKEVFLYVEENYKNKIYIDEVAELLGYNSEYFSRFFKKNTGLNFTDFLLDYRLTKARWDLLTSKQSINEIIYNNGFSNTATFYRNFKEFTGCSPNEYKKRHRKQ